MDSKTETALRQSHAKWQNHADNEGMEDVNLGPKECPLCALFWDRGETCAGCPVAAKTGKPGCEDTPYSDAWMAHEIRDMRAFTKRAQEMADFLKGLLP